MHAALSRRLLPSTSWRRLPGEMPPTPAEGRRSTQQASGFIGQGQPPASAYHDSDFKFEDHAREVRHLVEEQHARGAQLLQSTAAAAGGGLTRTSAYSSESWDAFYRQQSSVRFFKERRYLLLEFPDLMRPGPLHVAEIGCGCGSSLFPVLNANSGAVVTATDVSPTCIDQFKQAATTYGIQPQRIKSTFVVDASDPCAAPLFGPVAADLVLVMFTLSALAPPQQAVLLRHAYLALKPGGRLLVRDHGLYDMVQLRIPPEQLVGPNLYRRGDGTLAHFFAVDELSQAAAAAGFARTVECKYACVVNRNGRTGQALKRVFVHGVFEK